ncbi:MAG: sensor histidine kinase [Ignavibacteriales bacterium]
MNESSVVASNPILWFLIYNISFAMSAALFYILLSIKINWKRAVIFAVLCSLLNVIFRIYTSVEMVFFSGLIMLLALSMIILKLRFVQTIIVVFLSFLVNLAGECMVLFIDSLLGIQLKQAFQESNLFLINTTISLTVFGIITLMIYYFKMRINYLEDINRKKSIGLAINAFITVILILPNLAYFFSSANAPFALISFNLISIFIFFLLAFYNTRKGSELNFTKSQLENQLLYNKTLTDLVTSLRSFRHDFSNTLNSISGYLITNDFEGLKKYFDDLRTDYSSVNSLSFANSTIINNPPVYGLIVSAYYKATSKSLNVNMEILSDLIKSKVSLYDLCKILGIFWDNAIEAAETSSDKKINFYLKEIDNNYHIVIENSYTGEINIQKIFEKDYSTKGSNHGLGLWEVKTITQKSKLINLKTSTSNNMFRHELIIPIE